MVRIRTQPKPVAEENVIRKPPRKRKFGESTTRTNGHPTSIPSVDGASPRHSKRTRTTQMPYQSPESVDVLLVAAAIKRAKTAPVGKKDESTPKKPAKVDLVKAPKKPIKRLEKKASPKKTTATKSPIRRKVLKSPAPVKKSQDKIKASRTNTTAISKKLNKAGKVVAKAKTVAKKSSQINAGVTTGKKRKGKDGIVDSALSAGEKVTKKVKVEKKGKGKLTPKPDLTSYEKEPMFETKSEIPFISTVTHSRLLIRAVVLNDMKMLKKLAIDEPEKIYSFAVPRSAVSEDTVFEYICRQENKEAFKILNKPPEKSVKKLGSTPTMMISTENTGRPSYMMFGHAMRQVSVARGGKEGNNAFLYDYHNSYDCPTLFAGQVSDGMIKKAMELGVSQTFIDFLRKEISQNNVDYLDVHVPLRKGFYRLAGPIIEKANKHGGYGFNLLHEEVLTKSDKDSLTAFKPVSVTKKCTYDPRFAPLHCAAINPNGEILAELLRSMPDYNLMDKDGWTVGHYAAVCSGPEPLKYLLQFGISTHAVTSTKRGGDGFTLLHAAVNAGRAHNVKLILEHEKKVEKERMDVANADENVDEKGKQKMLLQNDIKYKITTKGKNALQMACERGHSDIVRLLLEAETDPNKQTPAKQDSVTPLMLAAMHGHLEIVKMLVDFGVKVDAKDKRGRTAAHHAAMNGQTHVLSYLLRLGVNHLALDTSGNSLLHYSAAYGWYFATMLCLEAGCPPNAHNHWKMTPMAIAFMKGHTGLVTVLMRHENVDVNAVIDDASGRTLLLETCSKGWDLARLKFLVEELGADPLCEDFSKNNALHVLTTKSLKEERGWRNDFAAQSKAFYECLCYLMDKGCNPFKKNLEEISPTILAAQRSNLYFLSKLLERGVRIPFEKDSSGNTLLHYLSSNFGYNHNVAHTVFTKLCSVTENITVLKEMAATHNNNGLTPLLVLLKDVSSQMVEEKEKQLLEIVKIYFQKLGADVNAKIEGKSTSQQTLLHLTIGTSIFNTILKQKPALDPLDSSGQTPLVVAILKGQQEAAEALISAGANVNFKIKEESNIGLLLYTAMKEERSFYLLPKLIAKGANPREIHPKTKNSVLHYIANKPTLPHAAEALSAALQAGVNPNLVNSNGRTSLHIAVNARGSETDVFYDIEDALITANANLTIRDERGRIPLHYCFVKRANPTNKAFFDPIELVSHLVTAMKSAGTHAEIHSKDVFGATPLHYAAFRGATICSSFLMQPVPRSGIDVCDNNGNTPFGLAVRNQHEGCALNFFQKDADYLRTINNDIKIQDIKATENASTKTKNEVWVWDYIKEVTDEAERLKEDQEIYPILEQVVKNDWQGMLYLMIGQLQETGKGFSIGIITALKLQRLKLVLKVALKVKQKKELTLESGTLFHILAKYCNGSEMELNKQIFEVFRKLGLNPIAIDEFGSQPAIYSMINRQVSFCDVLYGNAQDASTINNLATMKPDLFGRTPFNALFWKLTSSTLLLGKEIESFALKLTNAGANPNQLCEYPIKLSSLPGVRFTKKLVDIAPSNAPRYSPLILAVIVGNYTAVKWLLTLKQNVGTQVDVNVQDSKGRTAIMHAIRLNDVKMVKLLLDPQNYQPEKDESGLQKLKIKSTKVDFSIRDKYRWTVVDYLMFSPRTEYYHKNVERIVQLLQQFGPVANLVSSDGLSLLDKAVKHNRHDLIDILSKHISIPQSKKSIQPDQYYNFTSRFSQDITIMPVNDYTTAAEKMSEKIMEEARERLRKEGKDEIEKPKPDPLCGLDKDNAELIMDEQQNIPYDCIMTKVDISYGIYGLYNFYKMQLVKQPRGKQMIILFTEWGRVGQTGQYQKTPFNTVEEAVKEFTKIFKQKSGNSWDDFKNFTPIPTKYRVVPKDLRIIKYPTQLLVDFEDLEKAEKKTKSTLPDGILGLMKKLCFVHKNVMSAFQKNKKFGRYWQRNHGGPDYWSLPLLPPDVLLKAETILKDIGDRVKKYNDMQRDNTGKLTEKEKVEVADEIVKLSENFYQLIPVYGYATQSLEPMMRDEDLREKSVAINRITQLGIAKSLMLAAQYNMQATNPFEYVFRCLNTKIELLDRSISGDHEEMQLILQYIHNTGSDVKVFGIYRVEVPLENERLNATNIQNRQLLWHGTSPANMLSILKEGLQVAPLSSNISGHLFGKGIYLADVFEKSQHYCCSIEESGHKRKFMLLCEAALGKVFEVKLHEAPEKTMPKGYNSLKTADSKYEPDPESTIMWKGRTVALGEKKEKYFKEDDDNWYYRLDFNEYIVFEPDQVALRYLIEFED